MAALHSTPNILLSRVWGPDGECGSEDEEFESLMRWTPPRFVPSSSDREGCSPFLRAHSDTRTQSRLDQPRFTMSPAPASRTGHSAGEIRSRSSDGVAPSGSKSKSPSQLEHYPARVSGSANAARGQVAAPVGRTQLMSPWGKTATTGAWDGPLTMRPLSPQACLWEEDCDMSPPLVSRSTAPRMTARHAPAGHSRTVHTAGPRLSPRGSRSGEMVLQREQREQSPASVGRSPLRRCRDRREVARELHRRRTLACSRWTDAARVFDEDL